MLTYPHTHLQVVSPHGNFGRARLVTWHLKAPRVSVPRDTNRAFTKPTLEVTQRRHFCHSSLIQAVTRPHPDSRTGNLDSTYWRKNVKEFAGRFQKHHTLQSGLLLCWVCSIHSHPPWCIWLCRGQTSELNEIWGVWLSLQCWFLFTTWLAWRKGRALFAVGLFPLWYCLLHMPRNECGVCQPPNVHPLIHR